MSCPLHGTFFLSVSLIFYPMFSFHQENVVLLNATQFYFISLSLSLMEKPSKNHPTFFLNPSSYTIDSWPPDLSVSASRWLTIASDGNLPQDRFFVIGLPFFGILSSTGWRKTLGCFSLFLFFLFFFRIFLAVLQIDSSICILFPYIGNAEVVCLHVNFLFASYK